MIIRFYCETEVEVRLAEAIVEQHKLELTTDPIEIFIKDVYEGKPFNRLIREL